MVLYCTEQNDFSQTLSLIKERSTCRSFLSSRPPTELIPTLRTWGAFNIYGVLTCPAWSVVSLPTSHFIFTFHTTLLRVIAMCITIYIHISYTKFQVVHITIDQLTEIRRQRNPLRINCQSKVKWVIPRVRLVRMARLWKRLSYKVLRFFWRIKTFRFESGGQENLHDERTSFRGWVELY